MQPAQWELQVRLVLQAHAVSKVCPVVMEMLALPVQVVHQVRVVRQGQPVRKASQDQQVHPGHRVRQVQVVHQVRVVRQVQPVNRVCAVSKDYAESKVSQVQPVHRDRQVRQVLPVNLVQVVRPVPLVNPVLKALQADQH